mgnify:CR=1 FL=1
MVLLGMARDSRLSCKNSTGMRPKPTEIKFGVDHREWRTDKSFDPAARLTSVAIGYNLAQTVGGLAPMIATLLNDDVSRQAPSYVLTGLATISLTGLWVVAPQPQNARFTPAATTEMAATQSNNNLVQNGKEERDTQDSDHYDDDENELL